MSDDIRRNLRIGVKIDGTEQGNRKLGQTAGSIDQITQATDKADASSSRFAETMLKRSAAIDKNLQRGEELFKGSDRLLSIMGKLTGAIGLGTLAWKAGGAALEFITGKQKKAALAAKRHTKALEDQARAMAEIKRFRSAGDAFVADFGVPIEEIDSEDLRRAKALTEEAERRRENVARAADEATRAARALEKFEAKGQLSLAQSRVNAGLATDATFRRIDALKAERAVLKAAADQAIADQERLRDKALDASSALFNFKGQLLIETGAAFNTDPVTDAPTGGGGGGAAPPQKPDDIRKLIGDVDALIAKGAKLRQVGIDAAAYALPFDAFAIEQITTALSPLEQQVRGLGDAFSGLGDFVAGSARDFRDMVVEGRVLGEQLETIKGFGLAAGESFAAAGIDALFFGGSVNKAIAAAAKQASAEAALGALKSLAKGTIATVENPPAAAAYFKGAALWAGVSALAGTLGAAVGGGGSGGGRGALPAPTSRDLPSDRGGKGGVTIQVNMDLKSRPFATDRDVEDAILSGATAALKRAGGGGASFRRAVSR